MVQSVMTAPPVTIESSATVQEAARVMRRRHVGCILAMSAGHAVGIITESDLTQLTAIGGDASNTRVATVMSSPVATIPATTQLEDAAALMRARRIKRLAVVVGTEVRGIVTAQDLAYALPESKYRYREALNQRWVD